jgi:hypothetical protein
MATTLVDAIIQVKRGTEPERSGIIFRDGELAYSTDVKRLFVGDGVTTGGNAASSKLYFGSPSDLGGTIYGLMPGDYFIDTSTASTKLYALTGTNFTQLSSYILLSDNTLSNSNIKSGGSLTSIGTTNEFLEIQINGNKKYIRLWDQNVP